MTADRRSPRRRGRPPDEARLLLSSGDGPRECRLALARLRERIAREALRAGLAVEAEPEVGEPRSVIMSVRGTGARAFAEAWIGGVRWVCRSPFRPHHKRRNWFVAVFALGNEALPVLDLDSSDLRIETFRAGGPGGQHQNTTDSAVRVTHAPSGLAVVSREERSQHRNRARALERLRAQLFLLAGEGEARGRSDVHACHRELERGNPARTFEGEAFRERR